MATFGPAHRHPPGCRPHPAREYFLSPEIFGEERDKIFYRNWLLRRPRRTERELPGTISWSNSGTESVIVVRDQTGSVRAFHNTCRHRGTRLCEEHQGQFFGKLSNAPITPGPTGWTAASSAPPSTHDLEGFNKAGLAADGGGHRHLAGVHLSASGRFQRRRFASQLSMLEYRVGMYNLKSLRSARQIVYDVKANWKLLIRELLGVLPLRAGPPGAGQSSVRPPAARMIFRRGRCWAGIWSSTKGRTA